MRRWLLLHLLPLTLSCATVTTSTGLSARIQTDIAFIVASNQIVSDYTIYGNSAVASLDRFMKYSASKGVPVYRVGLAEQVYLLGMTACPTTFQGQRCLIFLDDALEPDGQLATFLHEFTHTRMSGKTKVESEVLAETVAYLTAAQLGLDTKPESMSYFLNIPASVLNEVLIRDEEKILKLVEELVRVGKQP